MQENQVSQKSLLDEKPPLYCWRWLVLTFFTLAVFMNSIPGEIYVPAADDTEQIYATTETMVTLASTSYVIMHPILSIPCSQFIVKYGWATATNIGVTLTLLGSVIKLLVNKTGFFMIIIGQLLIGAGKPFILNSQATMAQNWFYPEQRPTIIILLNVLNLISNVVTLIIPGKWIFKNYDYEDTSESIDEGKSLMDKLNLVQIYMILSLLPCYFFLRNQAPTAPSNLNKKEDKTTNIIRVMKKILANHNFICCLMAYSVYLGLVKSIVLILPFMFKAAGHGKQQVSVAGSIANIAAATSQATLAAFIQRFTNVKTQLIKVLMILSTASLLLFYFSLLDGNKYFIYFAIAVVGFFIMPISPVLMDISCDTVFPTSPSYAIATMYIGSQLLLVVFTQLSAVLVGGSKSTMTRVGYSIFSDIGLQILGLVLFSFIRLSKGAVVQSTHSLVQAEVQESFMNGRSQFGKGQAIKTSYAGSSFFNVASGIAFIGTIPTAPYDDMQVQQKKQTQYSSEIGQWDNNSQNKQEG